MTNKILGPVFNWFNNSFVTPSRLQKEFNPQTSLMMAEHELHLKNVEVLKLLEKKEKQFHENINLINDLRRVILYRYCK